MLFSNGFWIPLFSGIDFQNNGWLLSYTSSGGTVCVWSFRLDSGSYAFLQGQKNNSALYSQWPKHDQRVDELANSVIKNTLKHMWTWWSKPVALGAPTAFQQRVRKAVSRDLSLWPNFLFYLTPSTCFWKAAGCCAALKARLSILVILEAKLRLKGITTKAKHFISIDRCSDPQALKKKVITKRSDPQALKMASSLFFWRQRWRSFGAR